MDSRSRGQATWRRYRTVGERPDILGDSFLKRIAARIFVPFGKASAGHVPSPEEDTRSGWITTEHLYDTQVTIEKVWRDPYVLLALRIDRKRVPRAVLLAHVAIEETAARKAKGRGLKPAERRQVRAQVKDRLVAEAVPVSASYPMFWNCASGLVGFGNVGSGANDEFVSLFQATFELDLEPLSPFTLASLGAGGDAAAVERLVRTAATHFVLPAAGTGAGAAAEPSRRRLAGAIR